MKYLTVANPGSSLLKDRGSKFLGFAWEVCGEDDVAKRLDQLRSQHAKARHHCFAYRLGPGTDRWRAGDDGEPGHSAGTPILGQLDARGLTNVLVVVVRYFGGTKLGVGGLIAAYRGAAAAALEDAGVVERAFLSRLSLRTDYGRMPALLGAVKRSDWRLEGQVMDEAGIEVRIAVPSGEYARAWRALWLVLANAYPGEERLTEDPPGYVVGRGETTPSADDAASE